MNEQHRLVERMSNAELVEHVRIQCTRMDDGDPILVECIALSLVNPALIMDFVAALTDEPVKATLLPI